MEELYLLDKNLKKIHIIDTYSSVIWTPRYNTVGDCELVIQASYENLNKIKESKYISRDDDDMVCEIVKIAIETDEENGDQFIITGTDVKNILHQRIVTEQTNFSGLVEDYIRTLINDSIISPTSPDRKISNFVLGDKVGFEDTISQQVTYDVVGEKIEELCQTYGWGYKVIVENEKFVFVLYSGNDLSKYISFCSNYDNISTTEYSEDNSNIKNVAIIAGEGEGVERVKTTIGEGVGIDRHELYVDARDISSIVDYDELTSSYPNGTIVTISGKKYYQVDGVNIAIITYDDDDEISEVQLCDDIYIESLASRGYEKIADYASVTSFTGDVITTLGYEYKKDYELGDIVNIKNEYGISMNVRITEVIESRDDNGYVIEPTFENVSE